MPRRLGKDMLIRNGAPFCDSQTVVGYDYEYLDTILEGFCHFAARDWTFKFKQQTVTCQWSSQTVTLTLTLHFGNFLSTRFSTTVEVRFSLGMHIPIAYPHFLRKGRPHTPRLCLLLPSLRE